jgi:predicted DNA binding CopG/RHH family protein
MSEIRLEQEEAEVLEGYEAGEWRTVEGWQAEAERYQGYARATFAKDRRVNIRMSRKDLEGLQKRALEEGIPYQTLIASVLHKYVSGRLVERGDRGA